MTSDEFARIESLFQAVMTQPPERRRQFLQEADADPALRAAVERLIEQAKPGAPHPLSARLAEVLRATTPRPPQTIGPYHLVRELGAGGMGAVYLAQDPLIGRLVAVKLVRGDLDNAELLRRFEQEARSAGNLSHQNIVTIHTVGQHDGRPFIVMEYVRGRTLRDIIAEQEPLPLPNKLRIVEQLCAGLAYAHGAGVIHRDIKPGNVIVDNEGIVKILDFGLARVADSGLTQGHVLMGTLPYMSPEQYAGSGVDHRSDVFAVGAVFYELLTYRRAFPGTLEDGIMMRVLHGHPEPIAQHCPGIDPEIEAIVNRCLAKTPAMRYESLRVTETQIRLIRQRLERDAPAAPPGAAPSAGRRSPSWLNPEELKRRRAALVAQHMGAARRAWDAGDFDACLEAAQQALAIEDDHADALGLMERAKVELDRAQVEAWLREARRHVAAGALTDANELVDRALTLDRKSESAAAMRREIEAIRDARQRAEAVKRSVDAARHCLDAHDADGAFRQAEDALALEPGHADTLALRARAQGMIEERERRSRLDREAHACVQRAQSLFAAGEHDRALTFLADHQPSHPAVTAALDDMRRKVQAPAVAAQAPSRPDAPVELVRPDAPTLPPAGEAETADDEAARAETVFRPRAAKAHPGDETVAAAPRRPVLPKAIGSRTAWIAGLGLLAAGAALVWLLNTGPETEAPADSVTAATTPNPPPDIVDQTPPPPPTPAPAPSQSVSENEPVPTASTPTAPTPTGPDASDAPPTASSEAPARKSRVTPERARPSRKETTPRPPSATAERNAATRKAGESDDSAARAASERARKVSELHQTATRLFREGSLAEAADALGRGLTLAPEDAALGSLGAEMTEAAAKEMATAREAAVRARAADLAADPFSEATRAEERGTAARTDGRANAAIRDFLSAAERYRTAAAASREVLAGDEAAIRDALDRYEGAFERLDVPALVRAAPFMAEQANALERTFSGYRSYSMEIRDLQIDVDGDVARASAGVTRSFRPTKGRGATVSAATTFVLERRSGEWVITAVEAR